MFEKPKKPLATPLMKSNLGQPIAEDVDAAVTAFGASRFDMIIVASKRVRELNRGATPMVPTKSKPCVTALLEIQAGKVGKNYKRLEA
jgi:DNA-directed RNA polymerase omega subunit